MSENISQLQLKDLEAQEDQTNYSKYKIQKIN